MSTPNKNTTKTIHITDMHHEALFYLKLHNESYDDIIGRLLNAHAQLERLLLHQEESK